MHRYFCSGLLFAEIIAVFYVSAILGQSHYSIVAPGTIRSNRNYSVCVSLHDATSAATLRLTVRSLNSSMVLSQDVVLQPFETRLVNFMPPKLYEQFEYELRADALKGLTLSQSKKLYALEVGGPRIYVESDKSLYKPEDIVQFRVIILNEHVQITDIVEPIRIQILDPQKNRIKQFKDIKLDRGVFATKFQLSQQPILGEWTISVHISGKYNMNKEYTFKVQKYVLPKFSVHIEHDRNVVEADGVVKAIVYGKYTYGKYVEGTVELLLQDFERSQSNAIKKTVVIDNGDVKADVVIGIGKLDYSHTLYINATLKEKHTNVTATTEGVIQVKRHRYHLFVPDSSYEFRDGKPYRLKLHVEDWNGNAIRDRTTPVKMIMEGKEYSAYLDDNGVAQFRFEQQHIRFYGFEYKDSILSYENMFLEQSSYDTDSSNCHLVMKPRSSVDLKDPIEIDISANHSIPYLIYTLTSHGNIVREEFIRLSANQKSYTIQIKPSIAMVPHSYLFVYYMVNNQLHFCELTIRLPQHFENQISISAPTQVKPGQNITMTIKGQPNSRVSLVAVDKSVILLSSKNVLKKATIMNDLLSDRSYRQQYPNPLMYEYTPGHTSGLIIMTNAKYKIQTFEIPLNPTPFSFTTAIRSIFPETWIFKDLDINKHSTALTLKVPDTITTWIVRAFSVNDDTGFGMMEETLDIQAFQPFFISVNLPYSVKRGEVVTIPVTIFNYLRENLKTEVTMENNNEDFQFMNEENSRTLEQRQDSRNINIPANSGKSVAFNITPKKLGHIEIRITAKNAITSDGVVQKLKVEPEGICRNHNKEEFLTPTDGIAQRSSFEADIPPNIVPESEYLVLSVSGDVMVSTVENLDKLVQKPKGCGEQNMINMAPNILILDYLKTLGKYNNQTAIVEKAKNFIEAGYQQQLTYRHANGAFSVFGPKSSTESNWLTAYVTRFFIKGIKYSAIEPRIIEGGLQYLSSQQLDDGSFPHRGYLFEPAHQNQYGFTAFVLLTFLEDKKFSRKYNNVSEKALAFLTNNIDNVEDTYSLAIMANTFQRARSTDKNDKNLANEILTKLKTMARESNGLKWWTSNNKNEETANDVEITAYILMALLESTPNGDYLPIFNWLIKQRNSQGGFGSTHDTVVGLQALIKYAEKSTKTQDNKVKVHYVAKGDTGKNAKEQILEVDFNNELILQKEELPRTTRSVDVDVMGNGRIYLQFAYQYYVSDQPEQTEGTTPSVQSNKGTTTITPDLTPITQTPSPLSTSTQSNSGTSIIKSDLHTPIGMPQPASIFLEHLYFIIRPKAKLISSNAMSLDICYMYLPLTEEEKLTNMVILQVQLPSGFTANAENIETLRDEEYVSRIDIESSSTMISIYFEKLEAKDEQCLNIVADKGHDVAALKPSPIEMYDFYNDKRRSTIFYEIK